MTFEFVQLRGRIATVIVFAFIAGVLISNRASGQAVSQISGSVMDQSGAAIPGVQVTATQTETGTKRTVVSDSSGAYTLSNLPVGPYRLEASKTGFRNYVQTGIVLQVSSNPDIPIALNVGQVNDTIEVAANATAVETRAMGVGSVVENQRILDLPLNGRQPTDLIVLAGAAVQTGASPQWGMRTGIQISVTGGLTYGVSYTLDGAQHSNFYDATSFPLPFPDSLQEFKLQTSSLNAQQGTHSGASVDSVTKSGTNAFHGDVFEFLRNEDLNARNFFQPARDILKRNQFGGVIGGPIKKDKLFFFAGYQGTTIAQTVAQPPAIVPTAAELKGDFSAYAACNPGAPLRGPLAGNKIDPKLFNPASVKISQSFLSLNSDPCGKVNYSIPEPEKDGQIVGRMDYQLNDKQAIFGRYMATWNHAPVPYTLPGASILDTNNNGLDDLAQSVAIGHTWLFSANTVNSFRVAMNREAVNHPGSSFFGPSDVGINAYASLPHAMWALIVGGPSIGFGVGQKLFLYNTTFHLNDDVNIVRGSHQFAFGGTVSQALVDGLATVFSQGFYIFAPIITGSGIGDFLMGNMAQFQQETPNGLIEYQRYMGLYAQDTWKVSPRLTLNYGLRWEPFFPMQSKTGQVYSFSLPGFYAGTVSKIYPNAPPGFTYPGDQGFNGNSGQSAHWNDFQPRVGFAWDPKGDGRTSIRGGAGIAYDFVNMQLHHNDDVAAPFGNRLILNFPQAGPISDPYANYPGGNPFPYDFKAGAIFPSFAAFQPIPSNLKTPQVQQWNLAVQRQITPDWFASVSYVGNHALHILNQFELNPAPIIPGLPILAGGPQCAAVPVQANCASNLNQRRLLYRANPKAAAGIGNITAYDDSATSDYNGLLLNSTYRTKGGVNINANYTWSHCIGDANVGNGVPGPANNQPNTYLGGNSRLDRGDCLQDIRHLFNLTAVAQTPRFNNSALRMVASNWTLSVIYQYRSGQAFGLGLGSGVDPALSGVTTERPNQVLANPYGTGLQYLNPAAFSFPALGTIGSMGANSLHGPGFWEIDTALVRAFRIREGQHLEVRAEAFNLTNSMRPNPLGTAFFGNFSALSSGSQFGLIQSAYDPRILQFAMKFVF